MSVPSSWSNFVTAVMANANDYRVSKVCTRTTGPKGGTLEVCVLVEHRPAPRRVAVEVFCVHFGPVLFHPNTLPSFAAPYDIKAVLESPSQLAPHAVSRYFEDLQGTKHEFISLSAPRIEECGDCCR